MNERSPTGQGLCEAETSALRLCAVARACSIFGLGFGLLGMIGWLINKPLLTSVSQEYVPMSPWTATGFILSSFALLFEVQTRDRPLFAICSRIFSAFTAALAAVCLFAMLTRLDSGFEGEPFQPPSHFMKGVTVGVSFGTAVGFVLLACGLLVLRTTPRLRLTRMSPVFGLVVVGGSFTVLLGYLYGTPLLYGGFIKPVSPTTAVTFFLLGIGLVAAAGPGCFPTRLFVGETVSARMMRTFVPVTFIVVLLDELLSDLLRQFNVPNRALHEALQSLVSAIIVSLVVYQVARVIGAALDRANAERDESERALGRARSELENRVKEQTSSLATANEELRREIHSRNEAQRSLQESEKRFRQLTENIREVFWMTDPAKNQMIYISPGYEEIWGRTCRSLYASPRDWVTAIHPEDRDRVVKAALTKQASGNYDEEYRVVRTDGSIRWVRDRAFPVHEESGRVYRIAGIAEDITGRKGAEAHIAKLAHAVESTAELICITDLQYRFTYVNRAFLQAHGYTEAEVLGKTPDIFFAPEQPPSLLQETLTQTRFGGWQGELVSRRENGTEFPIFLSTSQIKDSGDRLIGFMAVARDITERRRTEEQIRLLADAVQSTQELISITDHKNRFTFVNRAFLDAYGYSEAEVLGRTPDFLYASANPAGLCEQVFQQTTSGGWQGEILNVRKNGTEFPISLSTSQIKTSAGKTLGLMGVARDISERKRSEKQNAAFALLGRHLSGATTPGQAAYLILDIASELFGWDAGYVHLYSQREDKIIPVLTVDTIEGQRTPIPPDKFTLDPSPLMRTVLQEGSRLINREEKATAAVGLVPFGDISRRSAAMMYVPIHARGNVLGILSIQSYTPHAYSEPDLHLLQILADHCGEALLRIEVTEAMLAAEARYHRIFEDATEGIFQITPAGRYRAANPALARMLGHQTPEELMSSVRDVWRQTYVVPEKAEELKRLLETQGTVRGFEGERYRKDGSKIWISINGHAVRDAGGAVLYYEGTSQDITERKRAEAQLRIQSAALEAAANGVVLTDQNGVILWANPAFTRMTGYSLEDAIGRKPSIIKSNQQDAIFYRELWATILRGEVWHGELVNRRKDGSLYPEEMTITPVPDVHGGIGHFIAIKQDVTARKHAEETLRNREEQYRTLVEGVQQGIFTVDRAGVFQFMNAGAARALGGLPSEFTGRTVWEFFPQPVADEQMANIRQVINSGQPLATLRQHLFHGKTRWYDVRLEPLRGPKGEVDAVLGIALDVTERKRAEEELRSLAQRIIEAQEAERLRVARELHDGVNQLLASAKMRLRKVEETIGGTSPAAREIVARCNQLLVQALEENRRIARNLRPSDLDEFGLAVACKNLCQEFQSRTTLLVESVVPQEWSRLPAAVELNLFRIVQEAFNNVENHAHAKTVWLQLAIEGSDVLLRIRDDGGGFDSSASTIAKKQRRGIGLTNMRERAASVGGLCEVVSQPKQGTAITVRVPCEEKK